MSYSVYSVNELEEKADFDVLIPVTIQEVIIEEKRIRDDFIYTAVKRLKKQDRNMPNSEIANKLIQPIELIDTILDRIRKEEPDSDRVHDEIKTERDIRYIVFNQITGLVVPKLFNSEEMKEVSTTTGLGREKFDIKGTRYNAYVLDRNLFAPSNLTDNKGNMNHGVKRLFTEVGPDMDSKSSAFGYLVIDIYPNGKPRDAYILNGISWLKFSIGKDQCIKENAWQIGSFSGHNRIDIGLREQLLNGKTYEYKNFCNALHERFLWLYQTRRYRLAEDNQELDRLNADRRLGFDSDLIQLINERQQAVYGDRSGVIQKIYGVMERELLALLNKETKSQKHKIRDAVKNMSRTWQVSVQNLFSNAGLTYRDEYFGYFSKVTGNRIHNMLFEERQAEFGTAFIALLVKQSFTYDYTPIRNLAEEYPDFMVEFDNLDLQERRNKEKHKGLESEAEGAIRLAGNLEEALFGINLLEELGFKKFESKHVDSAEIGAIAVKLGIPDGTELYDRFAAAYNSYLLCDSKFYPDCENVLVELYNQLIHHYDYVAEANKADRNDRVSEYLKDAGYEPTEVMNMTLLKSRTAFGGERLLAQAFLDLIVSSGMGDRQFIKLLAEKKHILQLVNDLYEAISHYGKPFEQKQCSQFLELIEEQCYDLLK